jgi:hypothetical protein
MERDGTRFARHGAVLEAGDRIVWIDVAGPNGAQSDVSDRARAVLESLRVSAPERVAAAPGHGPV